VACRQDPPSITDDQATAHDGMLDAAIGLDAICRGRQQRYQLTDRR
jgi:hypothetical protein